MKNRKHTSTELFAERHNKESIKEVNRNPIYAVLENIRSSHNVGAMFRTADACLLKKIFLTGFTPTPPSKEIDKTSLGADEIVPYEYRKDATSLIKELKEKGIQIIGLELTKSSVQMFELKPKTPCCFIVGNEIEGISDEALDLCDLTVEIPMLGKAHSLNVSTSFGILSYHLLENI